MAVNAGADGRRILVLGAGPAQLGVMEAARARGLYVVAVDRNPTAPAFRFADRRAVVSVEDEPAVDRLAGAEHVDGVIAAGIDFPVAIAARIAARQGIPHPLPAAVAQLSVSKLRQRERLGEAGVPCARFRVCGSVAEAEAAVAALGLPCVVKPPDRQGQRGLSVVADRPGVARAFEEALQDARMGAVLVEELVDGPELTVNAFSVAGTFHPLTVTDRELAQPPAFGVALAHVWPSSLPAETVREATEVARRAVEAVGIADGPSYTQVLCGPEGPVVGEVAARLGGGHDAELCRAALGVDLDALALSAALAEPIEPGRLASERVAGGACVRFLVPPEGILQRVEGAPEAEAVHGVEWVRIYREPGHDFGPFRRGGDRAGAVLATGSSRGEAVARAIEAAARVRFHTVAPDALGQT